MRAFTVLQPWASLLAAGVKRFETRGCDHGAQIGERIAIHAGKRKVPLPSEVADLIGTPETWVRLCFGHYPVRGSIIATARVVCVARVLDRKELTCIRGNPVFALDGLSDARERTLGDWSEGRVVVGLNEVRVLRTPVPARGALGLWRVPEAIEAAVIAAGGGE